MSISYEEALSTLQSMFGSPWTRSTLDAVLRHHKGHMENTVDSVLSHGSGDPQALINKLKSNAAGTSYESDAALARDLASKDSGNASAAPAATRKKGRGTPTTLPPDFLRIPGYTPPAREAGGGAGGATPGGDSVDQDEMLARMLQDEFFSQELANNPEFAHLANGRRVDNNQIGSSNRIGELPNRNATQKDDGPNIMENIAKMGDATKKRLQLLAANWNAKLKGEGNGGNKQQNGRGDGYGNGTEYRSLLLELEEEDEETEMTEMSFASKKSK